jgi:hypothetical protein
MAPVEPASGGTGHRVPRAGVTTACGYREYRGLDGDRAGPARGPLEPVPRDGAGHGANPRTAPPVAQGDWGVRLPDPEPSRGTRPRADAARSTRWPARHPRWAALPPRARPSPSGYRGPVATPLGGPGEPPPRGLRTACAYRPSSLPYPGRTPGAPGGAGPGVRADRLPAG